MVLACALLAVSIIIPRPLATAATVSAGRAASGPGTLEREGEEKVCLRRRLLLLRDGAWLMCGFDIQGDTPARQDPITSGKKSVPHPNESSHFEEPKSIGRAGLPPLYMGRPRM